MEKNLVLLRRYPHLPSFLPWVSLGRWPTPVEELSSLERKHHLPPFFVKRGDRSSERCGGNKLRELDFSPAGALRHGCRTVMTMGAAGSNHALATAIHGRRLGLDSDPSGSWRKSSEIRGSMSMFFWDRWLWEPGFAVYLERPFRELEEEL